MYFGDVLNLCFRINRGADDSYVPDVSLRTRTNAESDVNLFCFRMFLLFGVDAGPVVAILFHQPFNAALGAIELFVREQLPKLKFGGVCDLIFSRPRWCAFHRDLADEIVWASDEKHRNPAVSAARGFDPDVLEAPGGGKSLNTFANAITVQRLTRFLWN